MVRSGKVRWMHGKVYRDALVIVSCSTSDDLNLEYEGGMVIFGCVTHPGVKLEHKNRTESKGNT